MNGRIGGHRYRFGTGGAAVEEDVRCGDQPGEVTASGVRSEIDYDGLLSGVPVAVRVPAELVPAGIAVGGSTSTTS